jgi:hypothetical protein
MSGWPGEGGAWAPGGGSSAAKRRFFGREAALLRPRSGAFFGREAALRRSQLIRPTLPPTGRWGNKWGLAASFFPVNVVPVAFNAVTAAPTRTSGIRLRSRPAAEANYPPL